MTRRPRGPAFARLRNLAARFGADERGEAVEFALVAIPFFGLLFGIMQTAVVIFAGQTLQTMTSSAARKLMTGELQMAGGGVESFRQALCGGQSFMFDCDKVMIQVEAFGNFADANPSDFINGACFQLDPAPPASCYKPGDAQSVVLIRVAYAWPFGVNLEKLGEKPMLVAISAIRSEPYQGSGSGT